jgi:acetylornithine deacetylase
VNPVSELVQQLVAIDSINPDLVPNSAGEGAIARFIAEWLTRAGLEVELYEVAPGRPNVVAIARGTGGGRSLMLNGHTDTVGVAGMQQPHTPRIEGGRLYGRGAYDMKGGLAMIMQAAAELAQRKLRGDIILTAVCDEEYASIGTRSIVERWKADAAIISEPMGLDKVCIAHKGFAWFDIETIGVAAHGSLPNEGVDAIAKMGHVLVGLERLNQRLQNKPAHPLLGHGSIHASLIQGGQELSSYPAHTLLQVERRTIPGETDEVITAEIQQVLQEAGAATDNFTANFKMTLSNVPFEIDPSAEIVQLLCKSAEQTLGNKPELIGTFGWMDSAILAAAGIPTVIYGPSGEGAHAVVEWVALDDLERGKDVLVATAQAFCS